MARIGGNTGSESVGAVCERRYGGRTRGRNAGELEVERLQNDRLQIGEKIVVLLDETRREKAGNGARIVGSNRRLFVSVGVSGPVCGPRDVRLLEEVGADTVGPSVDGGVHDQVLFGRWPCKVCPRLRRQPTVVGSNLNTA